MAKKESIKTYKKPFDSPDFVEISKSDLSKELGESEIDVLKSEGKLKTAQAIYKTKK